jgi:hypothetical protein
MRTLQDRLFSRFPRKSSAKGGASVALRNPPRENLEANKDNRHRARMTRARYQRGHTEDTGWLQPLMFDSRSYYRLVIEVPHSPAKQNRIWLASKDATFPTSLSDVTQCSNEDPRQLPRHSAFSSLSKL